MQGATFRSSVWSRGLAAVVAAGLLLFTGVIVPEAGGAAPIQQIEYDEGMGREAALLSRLESARTDLWKTAARLNEIQVELDVANRELLASQAALDEAVDQAEIAAVVADDAEQREVGATERLRRQIVAAYVTGGEDVGAIEALLTASSTDDAAKAMTYSRAVVGDTDALVSDLGRAREIRGAAEEAAESARRHTEIVRDEMADVAALIQQGYVDQQRLADEMTVLVAAETEALQQVQSRRFIIESRINSMNRASDGIGMILVHHQQGQPDWSPDLYEVTTPLPGRRIGSKFGQRLHPILGITRLHAGGDIGAPTGTPLYAVADGKVLVAETRGGYGNTIVIDHGASLGTVSAHLSRIDVAVGDTVRRGDQIGLIGSTGLSTGPHLHLETRLKGLPVDPEGVIDWEAEIDYPR